MPNSNTVDTGSNYRVTYNVDVVFCIDCTGSMEHTLDIVKNNALNLYGDLMAVMQEKAKSVNQFRIRVIAFRDYLESMKDGHKPMLATNFYTLPQEQDKFAKSVSALIPAGGGDDPEDGLEALGFAIRSKWDTSAVKSRHVIVLWTDNAPHPLGFGSACPSYPEEMAKSLDELTAWWGDGQQSNGYMPDKRARRLVLYAPNEGAWKTISDNWEQVVHYTVALNQGVEEHDYGQIIDMLAKTLGG